MEKPWFKNWPDELPKTLRYPDIPLYRFLEKTAESSSNRTAIIYYDAQINFGELNNLTNKFLSALRDFGLRKGDRIALYLPNIPQFIIAYYGSLKNGLIIVPCNPMYKERELEHQLNDSGAKVIVTLDTLYSTVKNVQKITVLEKVIVTNAKEYAAAEAKIPYPYDDYKKTFPETIDFKEILERYEPSCDSTAVSENDLVNLQYTAGTTAFSKGVMLTNSNFVATTVGGAEWANIKANDVILGVPPFFHITGMVWCMNIALYVGATTIPVPRFEAEDSLEIIQKYKTTFTIAPTTFFVGLMNHPRFKSYDLKSLRLVYSGGAPVPASVQERWHDLTGGEILIAYGLSETCSPGIFNLVKKPKRGSLGVPFIDTDVKIVDSALGKELPIGETGEILVKGPQVAAGYWNKPEETVEAFRDEWLYTGDIGRIDEDGYIYYVDRKKDLINVSGYKVWPNEIESVLYQHPSVKEVAVIGVPDAYRGETVKAFVVLKYDEKDRVKEEDLINYCKESMAAYKYPRMIEFRDELPKSAAGKMLRRELKREEMEKRQES